MSLWRRASCCPWCEIAPLAFRFACATSSEVASRSYEGQGGPTQEWVGGHLPLGSRVSAAVPGACLPMCVYKCICIYIYIYIYHICVCVPRRGEKVQGQSLERVGEWPCGLLHCAARFAGSSELCARPNVRIGQRWVRPEHMFLAEGVKSPRVKQDNDVLKPIITSKRSIPVKVKVQMTCLGSIYLSIYLYIYIYRYIYLSLSLYIYI